MYYHGSARRYLWRNSDRQSIRYAEMLECYRLVTHEGRPPPEGMAFIELDSGEVLMVPAKDVTEVER